MGVVSRIRLLLAVSVALAGLSAGSIGHAALAGDADFVNHAGLLASTVLADSSVYGVRPMDNQAMPAALAPWDVHADGVMPAPLAGSFGRFDTLVSDQFRTVMPFAGTVETALGPVSASGYAVQTNAPWLFADEAARLDYDLQDFTLSAALAPGVRLNFGYNVDMAGRFNGYDLAGNRAYDGLFYSASALASPYASLTDGGNFVGATIALANDLHVNLTAASLSPRQADFTVPSALRLIELQGRNPTLQPRKAHSLLASVVWDFANWGGLGLTAGQTTEENGLLGNPAATTDALTGTAKTTSVGLSARFGLGSGWVTTFSYNEGITQLNLRPAGGLPASDTLQSHAYGIAVAKHGLFSGNDALGLALSRPLQSYGTNGSAPLVTVPSPGTRETLVARDHLLPPSNTPETDVELGYVTTFFDGALALQANAGYQMNLAGQKGQNAMTVLSRAKINF